jgi:hypothetical protein
MNDAQAVQAVLDDLSASKLTAYKNLGLKDDWEVIQSYIFLLDLAGHFVVPLQLLEIALRNKMYKEVAKKQIINSGTIQFPTRKILSGK